MTILQFVSDRDSRKDVYLCLNQSDLFSHQCHDPRYEERCSRIWRDPYVIAFPPESLSLPYKCF